MKIVFMGTPQAAVPSLRRILADGHEVTAVYTQPDRPSGRGKKITFSPVKRFAIENGLNMLQPAKIKTPEAFDTFRSHKADIAVVVAYGRILPENFLNAFPKGVVNLHFSLLPKYRGAAPVNWAIVRGDKETGVTTMKMDAGLDTGDILLQRTVRIGSDENAIELMERLSYLGSDLLSETLIRFDLLISHRQNEALTTFAPLMRKEDGLISWNTPAAEIRNRVRGFQPYPSSYTSFRGLRLTVWQVELVADEQLSADGHAGTIIRANGEDLVVKCGNGSMLRLNELQPEGKRWMRSRDFINGLRPIIGEALG